MSNEDKMRAEKSSWEELDRIKGEQANVTTYHREAYDAGVKACAAIKDAEIAEHNERWKDLRNVLECTQKEVASHDLTIKELRKALSEIAEYHGHSTAMLHIIAQQALANSEHHNSRALEKILLEARIEEVKKFELGIISNVREYKTFLALKLAELNKE